ncbi:Hypothetical protein CAP_1092 [Chondromyces apiculatus DSM 436]|uniref:EamA family transporter n=1 Tax=Chondromyces apiculatus DSM 436 TaxID=1192034 RepID=A0A017ST80_9BACT|nr:Hypothetical protein CAP_1092 [Chondromyces apiculatus DSM 436]
MSGSPCRALLCWAGAAALASAAVSAALGEEWQVSLLRGLLGAAVAAALLSEGAR